MNESMLRSFIQLVAALAVVRQDKNIRVTRKHLETYLLQNIDKRSGQNELAKFDKIYTHFKDQGANQNTLQAICHEIKREFSSTQRFQLVLNLFNFFTLTPLDFVSTQITSNATEPAIDINQIAIWLNTERDDYLSLRHFISGQLHSIPSRESILIVADKDPGISHTQFMKRNGIKGYIAFLRIPSANLLLFSYNGTSVLQINERPIFSKQTYILHSGAIIKGNSIAPIFHGEIVKKLLQNSSNSLVTLVADNITYTYPNSAQGIKSLTLKAESGELTGIMGGSGVGKSTLIKLLCGNLQPHSGKVLINGHNLYQEHKLHQSLIGVMHQEECLIEELTVYENLYHSARVAIGNLSNQQLIELVNKHLYELDLLDCKNNRVGSPENRMLSGGQRKRLAIAMEIIRDPKILFVDEPTSGLSSADSLMVMRILKDIALSGKVVVVNIHQPSSEVYKLFDSILIIDKGGYPVFYGNPIEAILHFKQATNRIDKDKSGCEYCGNIKPEDIFELLEEHYVDETGRQITKRKIEPQQWHQLYLNTLQNQSLPKVCTEDLPKDQHTIPSQPKQFAYFFVRNLLTRLRDTQFLFFAILLPPALSAVASLFLRYSIPSNLNSATEAYTLFANPNIPSFFLMCVLASLFFGLIVSCEDIIRNKRIIARETNLGLSLKTFYNSKFTFLGILSAVQTIAFIIPGVLILEIKGITLALWLVLFMLSLSGNLLGLILSSTLKSVVAIYILVPFLIIPQILFNGVVVSFDNLNPKLATAEHVPMIGETMVSRWAMEAAIVHFYKSNPYQKPFFNIEFRESELRFRLLHLIPELNQLSLNLRENPQDITSDDLEAIAHGLITLQRDQSLPNPEYIFKPWTEMSTFQLADYLADARQTISQQYTNARRQRDKLTQSLYPNTDEGREQMDSNRNKYFNRAIDDLVRNKHYPAALIRKDNKFIQKSDPIYQVYPSAVGRSHFLAAYKKIGDSYIETYWYNIMVMTIMTISLYWLFILNIFPRIFKNT
ncbi:MAG: ATP-binding cassette domain-containing protein [Tenuifilaceae bacterium]|nr:ATP-binding cassette domain-containing protein [Tenuifilaceae bacterium]